MQVGFSNSQQPPQHITLEGQGHVLSSATLWQSLGFTLFHFIFFKPVEYAMMQVHCMIMCLRGLQTGYILIHYGAGQDIYFGL